MGSFFKTKQSIRFGNWVGRNSAIEGKLLGSYFVKERESLYFHSQIQSRYTKKLRDVIQEQNAPCPIPNEQSGPRANNRCHTTNNKTNKSNIKTTSSDRKNKPFGRPTCRYEGEDERSLTNHREMKTQCKIQWKKKKHNLDGSVKKRLYETFTTGKGNNATSTTAMKRPNNKTYQR